MQKNNSIVSIVFFTAALLIVAGVVSANPSGDEFEIVNSTLDGGGGRSSGGDFSLTGTIGQPDANVEFASGGTYTVSGGFWSDPRSSDHILKSGYE